jgi:hypothetical protein
MVSPEFDWMLAREIDSRPAGFDEPAQEVPAEPAYHSDEDEQSGSDQGEEETTADR